MRRASIGALIVAVLLGVAPAAHADRIEDARTRVKALRTEMDDVALEVRFIENQLDDLRDAYRLSQRSLVDARRELAAARRALGGQLAEVYRSGGLSMVDALLDPTSNHVPDRAEFVMLLLGRQNDTLLDAQAASASYQSAVREVATQRAHLAALRKRQQAQAKDLARRFTEARDLLDRLAGFPGGQTAYPAQSVITIGGRRYSCPVEPPYSYTDTWGAARSGGRVHLGTDIMAPKGAGELAYTDGVVSDEHSNTLGGIVLYIKGDNGDEYYYAHLSGYAVAEGTRVRAGQTVGYVGNTGDARYTAPHLHFEVHPGGGSAVNPYPYVKRVCG
ncbi:MAG TPA: M23 family metallopeptidase [Actinomycetes bacterium]|jgi:murein DD-endopeptidase MepM/ murein hydrolase activator NlpD|nr:M23 family metallopeptidase [Actinomycetes bacterium]